jgi:hypothetical protein
MLHQPDLHHGVFLSFSRAWQPLHAAHAVEQDMYFFEISARGQQAWALAMASGFLCETYQTWGDRAHLTAAKEYFELIRTIPEFKEQSLADGATGWAAGLLARTTGAAKYRTALGWIIPNLLAQQNPDGEFGPAPPSEEPTPGSAPRLNPVPMSERCERTADLTIWGALCLRTLITGASL